MLLKSRFWLQTNIDSAYITDVHGNDIYAVSCDTHRQTNKKTQTNVKTAKQLQLARLGKLYLGQLGGYMLSSV